MLKPLFSTYEESVDFDINIGILPESERQNAIDKLYQSYYKMCYEFEHNKPNGILPLNTHKHQYKYL